MIRYIQNECLENMFCMYLFYYYRKKVGVVVIKEDLSIMDKLTILSDAAKYDVSCSSSGVERGNNGKGIGNSKACGICHSFSADGRCISLLKILLTNECIYNCRYCINRSSNDVVRATFSPEEICELTMQFYRRNYIEGLFLSSGIIISPDETMKRMLETVILLRKKYNFGGYIHMKAIPGASDDIIKFAGWFVDRMSINLELPTNAALKELAPSKSRQSILHPMNIIKNNIHMNRYEVGMKHTNNYLSDVYNMYNTFSDYTSNEMLDTMFNDGLAANNRLNINNRLNTGNTELSAGHRYKRYVPAGQSSQMIIGATKETDYQLVTIAQNLYDKYDLNRVFYSAFVNVNMDESLPLQEDGKGVPLLREHRLYQADWLMRFYGFKSYDLLSEDNPNFNAFLDPKCDWAIRHLDIFPVEINTAPYALLLKVPGIGVKSARRIIKARRMSILDFTSLKKAGVVLKRAVYFITCNGRMMYNIRIDQDYITNALIDNDKKKIYDIEHKDCYKQLSLFDCNVISE